MSRSMIPSQQKLAEKLTILNDRGQGMLTRIYNIKKVKICFLVDCRTLEWAWFFGTNITNPMSNTLEQALLKFLLSNRCAFGPKLKSSLFALYRPTRKYPADSKDFIGIKVLLFFLLVTTVRRISFYSISTKTLAEKL